MAFKLRKYKYTGPSGQRPDASSAHADKASGSSLPRSQSGTAMEYEGLKLDILSSLKDDISTVTRSELKSAFAEDFDSLKNELREVKTVLTTQ